MFVHDIYQLATLICYALAQVLYQGLTFCSLHVTENIDSKTYSVFRWSLSLSMLIMQTPSRQHSACHMAFQKFKFSKFSKNSQKKFQTITMGINTTVSKACFKQCFHSRAFKCNFPILILQLLYCKCTVGNTVNNLFCALL